MSRRDLRLRLYIGFVLLTALVLLAAALARWPFTFSVTLAVLAASAVLAEFLAVEFSSINVSITYAICAATILLFGPAAGALVAGIATIPVSLMSRDQRFSRTAFNFGQYTLFALAGGTAYIAAGGRLLAGHPLRSYEIWSIIVPLTLLTAASFLVNGVLITLVVSLSTERAPAEVWKSAVTWVIPTEAALAVIALALAQVVASEGVIGLFIFSVPLVIARQFHERYVKLRRAYADTVRSLVAVIEAKDAYTRGHSERVAAYSVDIARRLGFSDERVERVELAALLHDLGKVGISRSILAKKTRLSEDEFELIKTHPDIGAHIIEEVPFLADLVPFIAGHHERYDGTGYGNRLEGESIPIEARVLGVADAFDAMTSSRPYRPAMTCEATVHELRRCAGSQFDQVIVETFVEALQSGAFAAVLREVATDEAV